MPWSPHLLPKAEYAPKVPFCLSNQFGPERFRLLHACVASVGSLVPWFAPHPSSDNHPPSRKMRGERTAFSPQSFLKDRITVFFRRALSHCPGREMRNPVQSVTLFMCRVEGRGGGGDIKLLVLRPRTLQVDFIYPYLVPEAR